MFGRNTKEEPKGKLVYAVLPAAGSSRRMGGTNKLLLELCGKPVMQCTLEAFDQCEQIDGIVLSCRKDDIPLYQELCRTWGISKPVLVVEGGESRAHSVYQGVLACPKEVGYVAIHDAARPLITPELIRKTVEAAKRDTAAALAVPVKDSIKRVKNGRMVENVDRDSIVAVQTPQAFDIDLIRAALCHVIQNNILVTDDCGAAEAIGQPTTIVQGDYNNIKITTVEDITVAEEVWKGRMK
ncbi:MAG: 2-C-methyl-D-erythritol 4-phosphate cytidylyltransferase [Butyricicoccus sp.]